MRRNRYQAILTNMQSILSVLSLFLIGTAAEYLLPDPPGKYNVTLTTGPLVDYARDDPYAKELTPRALMLSVFEPAQCETTNSAAYMPEKVAEYQQQFLEEIFNVTADLTPLFLGARLPVCPQHTVDCSVVESNPVLLFSPGYSLPRFYYNYIASAIASQGFTVILIDHPEDANILVYPDGRTIYSSVAKELCCPTPEEYSRAGDVRAADASFIIDQLGNATAMSQLLPQRGPRPFLTDRVAMLGHSLGGVASILAASRDSRVRGAINWAGTIFGSPNLSGTKQPVLFMTHDPIDPTWAQAWPQLEGPKLIAHISNTTHQTFTDVPTMLEAAGQSTKPFEELLGTIEPKKMIDILVEYTTAWMSGAFSGEKGEGFLPEGEPGKYPEVSYLKQGLRSNEE